MHPVHVVPPRASSHVYWNVYGMCMALPQVVYDAERPPRAHAGGSAAVAAAAAAAAAARPEAAPVSSVADALLATAYTGCIERREMRLLGSAPPLLGHEPPPAAQGPSTAARWNCSCVKEVPPFAWPLPGSPGYAHRVHGLPSEVCRCAECGVRCKAKPKGKTKKS